MERNEDQLKKEETNSNGDVTEKDITFIQYLKPQLKDGIYAIEANQTISSTTSKITKTIFQSKKQFDVRGERFSINPAEIVSVFPPDNSLGEYSNVLPHVILRKETLPWERDLNLKEEILINIGPWLGVILFNETDSEKAPKLQEVELIQLLNAKDKTKDGESGQLPNNTFHPDFPTAGDEDWKELEYGQSWTDKCLIIDIEKETFLKIAPTPEDLGWLAHAREVDLVNKSETYVKAVTSQTPSVQKSAPLAEVVCNQFPLAGEKAVVHLVSFEGFGNFLPNADKSDNLPEGTEKVRVVSLKSWNFSSLSKKHTFAGLLKELNDTKAHQNTLRIPYNGGNTTEGEIAVSHALEMGFAAFNHLSRMGDKMVSWYHGPFVPYNSASSVDLPINSADAVTKYNPKSGMFDVSLSSAWQLGRLLALQNKNFSTTMYNWKRNLAKTTIQEVEKDFINLSNQEITKLIKETLKTYVDPIASTEEENLNDASQLIEDVDNPGNLDNKDVKILKQVLNWLKSLFGISIPKSSDTSENVPEESKAEIPKPKEAIKPNLKNRIKTVQAALSNPATIREIHTEADNLSIPYTIANWLARLKLLYGIPFNYLVPDLRMLPVESIKFFFMDDAWINSLLEGAMSIGRSTTSDVAHDTTFNPYMLKEVESHLTTHRTALFGQAMKKESDDTTSVITGFLLRSQVVEGWPGLEVFGFDDKNNPLDLLRMDHLSSGVILCLFDGIVDTVNIQEHAEVLHFGVEPGDVPKPENFNKSLRYIDGTGTIPAGSDIPPSIIEPIQIAPFFRPEGSTVMNIEGLATQMGEELKEKVGFQKEFSSAQFALEMIEGVQRVIFKFEK